VSAASTKESTTRYYSSRESSGYWTAFVVCVGFIGAGASLAEHSWKGTLSLVLGAVAVWALGYWALSKSRYFISPTKAGFKDAFRTREVEFEEIRSVTKNIGNYTTLTFVCSTRTVTMPLDPIDETWFSDVKSELLKRGITVSSKVLGFTQKGE
jgi:hypothetical protein